MKRKRKCSISWATVALALAATTAHAQTFLNGQMPWHPVVVDQQGLVLAWYHPEKNLGYDHFLHLDWDFLEHKVPLDKRNGLKVYLTDEIYVADGLQGISPEPVTREWQHNPASLFSHQTDALLAWYPYSGDREAIEVVRGMLDYQLAHGTTPADWDWAQVPFATSCTLSKEYGSCIQDMPRRFFGGIETDKVGELGLSYVQFYELTGERKYLEAGIKCADQLAKHIRAGDAYHTPWPFRVDAHSGAVLAGEEYGGMIVAPVRLFDELIRIKKGSDSRTYTNARDLAWKWLLSYPMNKSSAAWDKWSGYYEDIPKDTANVNDMSSLMTAYYILTRDNPASVDKNWGLDVGHLLDRSRLLLGRGPYYGAWAIDEQMRPDGAVIGSGFSGDAEADVAQAPRGGGLLGAAERGCCNRAGLVCRTSAWGAMNALYFAKIGDGQARENAFRSLNYATYFMESDGKINAFGDGFGDSYWFEDGHADAGRNFIWAMGAVPEFAPIGEDHLLHSSSVVRKVTYAAGGIDYETFDTSATELLRLTFKPAFVAAGSAHLPLQETLKDDGYTVRDLSGGDYEVKIRHVSSTQISIKKS